jgi:ribosomal protein S18 acetylase RimI-like enzyme
MSVQLEALADEVFDAAAAQGRLGAESLRRPFGELVRNPAYPDLFFVNGIVDLLAPQWDVDDVERTLRDALPDARYFRVSSRDPTTIMRLGPSLRARGYEHERRVGMIAASQASSDLRGRSGRRYPIALVNDQKTWSAFEQSVKIDSIEHGWTSTMMEQMIALYRWRAQQTPHRYYLAFDGDNPAGHVGLFQHRTTGYLHGVYVHPTLRRRGLGSALTAAMHEVSEATGCERLTLQCIDDGYLPGYYQRLGFRAVGEQHIWTRPR